MVYLSEVLVVGSRGSGYSHAAAGGVVRMDRAAFCGVSEIWSAIGLGGCPGLSLGCSSLRVRRLTEESDN